MVAPMSTPPAGVARCPWCALTYHPSLAALPPRPGLYAGDDARSALVATHATRPTTTPERRFLVSDTHPKVGVGSDAASPHPTTATTRHQFTPAEEALLKQLLADYHRAMDQAFVDLMFGTTTTK